MELPPLSVYIHLPWCERKCPYCDFNSHETKVLPEQAYIEALLEDLHHDLPLVAGRAVRSVFIGGGTPSLFSVAAIGRLLDGMAGQLTLASDFEITLEANPGSAEAAKFAGFYSCGINRLSLGIQSFSDHQLQALGRIHSQAQAHRAIEYAREAGFQNFNIDLMHGLPDQTEQQAINDLEQALAYEPPHLSWYQLTIEPNTAFYCAPPQLPGDSALAAIQESGEAILQDHGMRNYEVSAYQRPGQHSRHNENYWSFGDYLGLGAGAHAKLTDRQGTVRRHARLRQPEAYLAAKPEQRICHQRQLSENDCIGEFMMNALRLTKGFTAQTFSSRTGLSFTTVERTVSSLVERQLLEQVGTTTRTTTLGRRFLDSVVGEFFDL